MSLFRSGNLGKKGWLGPTVSRQRARNMIFRKPLLSEPWLADASDLPSAGARLWSSCSCACLVFANAVLFYDPTKVWGGTAGWSIRGEMTWITTGHFQAVKEQPMWQLDCGNGVYTYYLSLLRSLSLSQYARTSSGFRAIHQPQCIVDGPRVTVRRKLQLLRQISKVSDTISQLICMLPCVVSSSFSESFFGIT
jgi:hypothetical protein